MTTHYRDENGKLLRTDKGTQPASKPEPKKPAPVAAPAAKADAPAPASKEK